MTSKEKEEFKYVKDGTREDLSNYYYYIDILLKFQIKQE